jgi:hypothetical protein
MIAPMFADLREGIFDIFAEAQEVPESRLDLRRPLSLWRPEKQSTRCIRRIKQTGTEKMRKQRQRVTEHIRQIRQSVPSWQPEPIRLAEPVSIQSVRLLSDAERQERTRKRRLYRQRIRDEIQAIRHGMAAE